MLLISFGSQLVITGETVQSLRICLWILYDYYSLQRYSCWTGQNPAHAMP